MNAALIPVGKAALFFLIAFSASSWFVRPIDGMTASITYPSHSTHMKRTEAEGMLRLWSHVTALDELGVGEA